MRELLNRLFSKTAGKDLGKSEVVIEQLWERYKEDLVLRKQAVNEWQGEKSLATLTRILGEDLRDTDIEAKLIDDFSADALLTQHARNIRLPDKVWNTLYDKETRHDYVRALLAHLHVALESERALVAQLIKNPADNRLLASFAPLFAVEDEVVRQFGEWVGKLPLIIQELLAGATSEGEWTSQDQDEYEALKPFVQRVAYGTHSRGIFDERAPWVPPTSHGIISPETMHAFENDMMLVSEYLHNQREALIEEGVVDDPQHPDYDELHQLRGEDLDLFLLNRPQFTAEVKALLEEEHGVSVPKPYLRAFVRLYREWANDRSHSFFSA